jgi:2-amino-4-hydroxy-6-hydroxymethyldihydropteridine diphosphokinase
MALAYVGIGSNVGDREGHLDAAISGLSPIGRLVGGSSIYETAPIGDIDQAPFLNAVVCVESDLDPMDLLHALLGIEASRGRERIVRWGPRTLDLDLLWYDGIQLEVPGLSLPHPEIRSRRFVLVPLVEVGPDLADSRGSYADALEQVTGQSIRRVTGPLDLSTTTWPPVGS